MTEEITRHRFPPPFLIAAISLAALGLYVWLKFHDGCPRSGNAGAFSALALSVAVVGEGLAANRRGWTSGQVTAWVLATGLVVAVAIIAMAVYAVSSAGCFS